MKGKGPALETGQPLPPIAHVCDLRLVAYTFWASLLPSVSWGSKWHLQDRRAPRQEGSKTGGLQETSLGTPIPGWTVEETFHVSLEGESGEGDTALFMPRELLAKILGFRNQMQYFLRVCSTKHGEEEWRKHLEANMEKRHVTVCFDF